MNNFVAVTMFSARILCRGSEFWADGRIRIASRLSAIGAVLIILISGSIAAGPAYGDDVAVLIAPFENASGRSEFDDLAKSLPDLLAACFSQIQDAPTVIERPRIDRAMDEIGYAMAEFSDPGIQYKAGLVVGVDIILRGSINLKNGELDAEVLAFNVTDTSLIATQRASLISGAIITSVCQSLGGKLAAKLTQGIAVRKPLPPSEDVEQQVLMMDGLKHYYSGDYARAIAPFLKLMRLAPDNESAQFWLGQSFVGAGLNDLAALQMRSYLDQFAGHARSHDVESALKTLTSGNHLEK